MVVNGCIYAYHAYHVIGDLGYSSMCSMFWRSSTCGQLLLLDGSLLGVVLSSVWDRWADVRTPATAIKMHSSSHVL